MSLQAALKAPIQTEVSLRAYSTLKIGGPAHFFSEPETQGELFAVLEFVRREELPLLVIGRGSNLLFSDAGFAGLVLSLRKLDSEHIRFESEELLRAPSGIGLYSLCLLCQKHSLGGTEFLCHIPGTLGGAVRMNAGFGRRGDAWHQIQDIVQSVTVAYRNGSIKTLAADELGFEYRHSTIDDEMIVLDVLLRLEHKRERDIASEIKANFDYRNAVQDLRYPSAGSTFKNPCDFPLSSGQILDRVGMKGMRLGGAQVSEKHANFFLNVDQAKAVDVLGLMEIAVNRAFEEFGVTLEPEVKWIPSGHEGHQ